jgi:hypothetical protein
MQEEDRRFLAEIEKREAQLAEKERRAKVQSIQSKVDYRQQLDESVEDRKRREDLERSAEHRAMAAEAQRSAEHARAAQV